MHLSSTMPTMSMVWMRMPGQTWPAAAASFIGMWVVMMVAMMLPSLVPMLWRYRQVVQAASTSRLGWLTALVAFGYFFVWSLVGAGIFPIGATLAAMEMAQPVLTRYVPIVIGAIVLLAGTVQVTAWKMRQLAVCRLTPARGELSSDARTAWRHGLRLGLHCTYSCAGLTAILLAFGVMNLRVMLVVTSAITVERLVPAGARIARAIGVIAIVAGASLMAVAVSVG